MTINFKVWLIVWATLTALSFSMTGAVIVLVHETAIDRQQSHEIEELIRVNEQQTRDIEQLQRNIAQPCHQ